MTTFTGKFASGQPIPHPVTPLPIPVAPPEFKLKGRIWYEDGELLLVGDGPEDTQERFVQAQHIPDMVIGAYCTKHRISVADFYAMLNGDLKWPYKQKEESKHASMYDFFGYQKSVGRSLGGR